MIFHGFPMVFLWLCHVIFLREKLAPPGFIIGSPLFSKKRRLLTSWRHFAPWIKHCGWRPHVQNHWPFRKGFDEQNMGNTSGQLSHNYGKSPCYQWVNPRTKWPFSIAMLVITRGYHFTSSSSSSRTFLIWTMEVFMSDPRFQVSPVIWKHGLL